MTDKTREHKAEALSKAASDLLAFEIAHDISLPEFDKLVALVGGLIHERDYAVRWANKAVDDVKARLSSPVEGEREEYAKMLEDAVSSQSISHPQRIAYERAAALLRTSAPAVVTEEMVDAALRVWFDDGEWRSHDPDVTEARRDYMKRTIEAAIPGLKPKA
jgi:hypothetical protein